MVYTVVFMYNPSTELRLCCECVVLGLCQNVTTEFCLVDYLMGVFFTPNNLAVSGSKNCEKEVIFFLEHKCAAMVQLLGQETAEIPQLFYPFLDSEIMERMRNHGKVNKSITFKTFVQSLLGRTPSYPH